MPTKERYNVNEGNNYNFSFVLEEDTSGETLSARIRATDGTGTGTSVGSTSGAIANTELTIQLGLSGTSPDEYDLEVWSDFGTGTQRLVLPDGDSTIIINVIDRFGVSN